MNRTIFHIDMDAFFASVEVVLNPKLKGLPLVVGGSAERRGVVSTCSYEARRFGIHSAMPTAQAKKLCPHAIFLTGNYSAYSHYSTLVMEILESITHKVEPMSIDEAYMDVSDVEGSAMELGRSIRKEILQKTGLTCSLGIAPNKMIAKIASSTAKPNGLYEIPHGMEKAFMADLPIGKIPGIGPKSVESFHRRGIEKVGDLQQLTMAQLIDRFDEYGFSLYYLSRGRDNRPVMWEEVAPKQVGAEVTFDRDLDDPADILDHLDHLLGKAHRRLLRSEMLSRGVTLKLRSSDFHTITRSTTFTTHTKQLPYLAAAATRLFTDSWDTMPLRLIGVSFDKLTDSYWQPLLWDFDQKP